MQCLRSNVPEVDDDDPLHPQYDARILKLGCHMLAIEHKQQPRNEQIGNILPTECMESASPARLLHTLLQPGVHAVATPNIACPMRQVTAVAVAANGFHQSHTAARVPGTYAGSQYGTAFRVAISVTVLPSTCSCIDKATVRD